jgi:hypothetical protein
MCWMCLRIVDVSKRAVRCSNTAVLGSGLPVVQEGSVS